MEAKDDRRQPTLIEDLFGRQANLSIPQGQFGVWHHHGPWRFRGRVSATEIWMAAILAMIAAVIFRIVFHSVDDAADGFVHSIPSPVARDFIGVVVLAVIGYLLWELRSRRRLLYAVIELGTAGAVAWSAAARLGVHDPTAWAAPLSAAYLFVRGIENLREGFALARADASQSPPEPAR